MYQYNLLVKFFGCPLVEFDLCTVKILFLFVEPAFFFILMHSSMNTKTSQVLQSGDPTANDIILSNMAVAFDRILLDVEV